MPTNSSKSVPSVVLNAFHSIRLAGNKAAHGESVARFNAPDLLEDAFHLGCWFFIINGGRQSDCPAYHAPERMDRFEKTAEELKRDKQRIQETLAAKESEMQTLLTELEAARVKTRSRPRKKWRNSSGCCPSVKPPQMRWALTRLPLANG